MWSTILQLSSSSRIPFVSGGAYPRRPSRQMRSLMLGPSFSHLFELRIPQEAMLLTLRKRGRVKSRLIGQTFLMHIADWANQRVVNAINTRSKLWQKGCVLKWRKTLMSYDGKTINGPWSWLNTHRVWEGLYWSCLQYTKMPYPFVFAIYAGQYRCASTYFQFHFERFPK